MAFLTREMIEKASELKTKVVTVPEWGGDVLIRELTGTERDAYEASLMADKRGGKPKVENLRARLVGRCMVDGATMQRLYSDQEVLVLGNKSAAVLDRLFDVCRELSGMTTEEEDKAAEALADDPNGSSGTPSP